MTWQALVDAPDMVRCQMNFKRLSLTDIKIDIKRVPKKKTLIAAMEAAGRDNIIASLNFGTSLPYNSYLEYLLLFWCCWQMLRTSGRTAHGAGSWLFRRKEPHLMTLIGLRSCWPRSRFVPVGLFLFLKSVISTDYFV